jgi:hypothetical protein
MDHEMSIMGSGGDTKCRWNPDNPESVAIAQETYTNYRGQGFLAFAMNEDGTTGDQLNEFDPSHENILFVPPMRGG